MSLIKTVKIIVRQCKSLFFQLVLFAPRKVHCNVCGWMGRRFLSDSWHKYVICPRCFSEVRHRLFFSALQELKEFSYEKVLVNKKILHFAPETIISSTIQEYTKKYYTADLIRDTCDYRLDFSHMPEIDDGAYNVVMAFDVLEHVSSYEKALEEMHRVLASTGLGILTVPQQDNLEKTFEDPETQTPSEREKKYGQWDHLRIFGDDFKAILEKFGFKVIVVDESYFSSEAVQKHVLFPPVKSIAPLATNYRKVFFVKKV